MNKKERLQTPGLTWPPYFQPRPGQESPPTKELLRIPANLLDVFYFRDSEDGPTELVVVLGCLGEDVDIVTGEAITDLPHDLKEQLKTVQVSQRQVFRSITAQELYVFSLDAVEQQAQTAGYNNAVYLYGKMHARLSPNLGRAQITPLQNEGRLTVGRLDMLHAYRESLAHVFQNPQATDEKMYHFMVPAAPVVEVKQGRGITLVYPILDPEVFDKADNSIIVMRIVYDLLSKLQQDMIKEGNQHPFTKKNIPVPSRRRLEAELEADGYEIQSNVATKRAKAHKQSAQGQITFLTRLREMASHWAEPHISLPLQAKPKGYLKIIDQVLKAVATKEDKRMMKTLSQRVQERVSPVEKPAQPPKPIQLVEPVVSPAPRSIPQPSRPPVARRQAPPPVRREEDWKEDFAVPVVISGQEREQEWWHDFAAETRVAPQERVVTSKVDWGVDFLAEQGEMPTVTDTEYEELTKKDDWEEDFSVPKKSQSSAGVWDNDFE